GLAAVGGLVEELAAEIERAVVEGIGGEAGVPVEPELHPLRSGRPDEARLAGAQTGAVEEPPLGLRIDEVGIEGIGQRLEAVAAAHRLPLMAADAAGLPDG